MEWIDIFGFGTATQTKYTIAFSHFSDNLYMKWLVENPKN